MKLSKITSIITCLFVLIVSIAPNAYAENNSYDQTYMGKGQQGYGYDNNLTTLFKLRNDADKSETLVYCVDRDTNIVQNSKYSRVNLEDAEYYSKENADKIRAIIMSSYPQLNLEELITKSKVVGLTAQEAVTATQIAIWHYAHQGEFKATTYARVNNLYKWLIELPGIPYVKPKVANISVLQSTKKNNDKITVDFSYKADSINADSTNISLVYKFDKNLVELYGAKITEGAIDSNGYKHVTISNLPLTATFKITVLGEQILNFDGYFYSPEGGRGKSQSLVGAFIGKTNVSKDYSYSVADYGVTVKKIDSVTLKGLAGAVLELANTNKFDDIVYTLTTNEDGIATKTGLTLGTWYLREIKAPDGYVIYGEIIPISVGDGITIMEMKNQKIKYAQMNLYKRDAITKEQIAGAVIGVFTDDKFLNKVAEVTTLADAPAPVTGLIPGTYYVKELSVPKGYLMDAGSQKIVLLDGDTAEVTFFNSRDYPTAGNYALPLVGGVLILLITGFVILKSKGKAE